VRLASRIFSIVFVSDALTCVAACLCLFECADSLTKNIQASPIKSKGKIKQMIKVDLQMALCAAACLCSALSCCAFLSQMWRSLQLLLRCGCSAC
jgi:ubiquinone biosynthesis protein COQ9